MMMMNRQEFILALRSELKKLPPEEVAAATEFYEEFIDEVSAKGEKTEEEIIAELGEPKRVAAEIKANYAARILDDDDRLTSSDSKRAGSKASAVWWVILGICSAPVSIPLVCCIAFVGFIVFFGLLGIMLGIYGAIIGCAIGAIGAIVLGTIAFAESAATGCMFAGGGLALAAIAAAAGAGAFIGTRALIRVIVRLITGTHDKIKNKKLTAMSREAGDDRIFAEKPEDPAKGFRRGGDDNE
ncbi:MAG: DUF1700 domain-containing protein [Bacillota bacterium]|nr:DUF1700 domain-containing protein [Bacillota bacterium]